MSPKYVAKEETDLWGNSQVVVRRGVTASDVGGAVGAFAALGMAAHRSGKQQQFENAIQKVSDYFGKGDYQNAIVQSDELLKLSTVESKLAAHLLRAQCYYEMRDFTKAATEFTTCLEIAETQNIPDWTTASAKGKSPLAWVLSFRGMCYFNDEKWGPAITDFKKCTQIDPNEPGSYLYLAICLKKLDDLDQALVQLDRLVELAPGQPSSYLERGRTLTEKHEYERAIADLSRAIKLDPTEQEAYKLRSISYLALGNEDKSKEDIQSIVVIEETKELPELDELISAIRNQRELDDLRQMLQKIETEWTEQEKIYRQLSIPFKKRLDRFLYGIVAIILAFYYVSLIWSDRLGSAVFVFSLGIGVVVVIVLFLILQSLPEDVMQAKNLYLELTEQRNKLAEKKDDLLAKIPSYKRVEQLQQQFGRNLSLDDLVAMREKRMRQSPKP